MLTLPRMCIVYCSKWSDVPDKSLRGVSVRADDTAKLEEDLLGRLEETRVNQHMLPFVVVVDH